MLQAKATAFRTDSLWFGNTHIDVKIAAEDGADGLSVVEHRMPCGEAPPLHVHLTEDEIFYVLSGEYLFEVGGREIRLSAGEAALAPKGVPHRFRVLSADGGRCLTITRGADFETMLRMASRPAETRGLPTPAAPTPEAIQRLTEVCAANRIDILGPPLA